MFKKFKVTDNYLELSFINFMIAHHPVTFTVSPTETNKLRRAYFEGAASLLSGLAADDERTVQATLLGSQREIDKLREAS